MHLPNAHYSTMSAYIFNTVEYSGSQTSYSGSMSSVLHQFSNTRPQLFRVGQNCMFGHGQHIQTVHGLRTCM